MTTTIRGKIIRTALCCVPQLCTHITVSTGKLCCLLSFDSSSSTPQSNICGWSFLLKKCYIPPVKAVGSSTTPPHLSHGRNDWRRKAPVLKHMWMPVGYSLGWPVPLYSGMDELQCKRPNGMAEITDGINDRQPTAHKCKQVICIKMWNAYLKKT